MLSPLTSAIRHIFLQISLKYSNWFYHGSANLGHWTKEWFLHFLKNCKRQNKTKAEEHGQTLHVIASRKHALSLVNPQAQLILRHSRLQGCSPTATQKGSPAHPLALPVPSPGPAPEEEPLGLTAPYAQPSFFYLPLLLTPKQLSSAPCLLHFYFYFCWFLRRK